MKYIILITAVLILISCENKKNETQNVKENTEMTKSNNYTPLSEKLDEKKQNFENKADDEVKRIYAEGIQAVVDAGILDNALNVGDIAPNFSLKNASGNEVILESRLKDSPVILVWYRGGWCTYCNITLQRLQSELPNFQNYNASLIAITPEVPDSSLSTSEKHDLQFDVLSDIGQKVSEKYGVAFQLTDEVAARYEKSFGLSEYNNDKSKKLPLVATYVIDTNGKITYAYIDADYRNRAEPRDIIEALEKLDSN
jgi:peroxiredoxin